LKKSNFKLMGLFQKRS